MAIPTVLVSGALGSGKTTLLKAIVAANPQHRFGIVVNEFGDMGVDGDLLRPLVPEIVEIRNGCICCATQDQLAPAINELLRAYHVDILLLEMSGVAEPLPVIHELRVLEPLIEVRSHAVVVDATADLDLTTRDRNFRNAVTHSTVMIVSKIDLAARSAIDRWLSFLGAVNSGANLIKARNGEMPLAALTDPRHRVEQARLQPALAHDARSHRFNSLCLFLESVTETELEAFVSRYRDKVARVKGIVRIAGAWMEIQAVRGDLRIEPFAGTAPDRGRLVFISSALYPQDLRRIVHEMFEAAGAIAPVS
jgi:G3E family GTPase